MRSRLHIIFRLVLIVTLISSSVEVSAQLFRRTINSTPIESKSEICAATGGGEYVAANEATDAILVIKYNTAHSIVWQQSFQVGTDEVELVKIAEDKAGNLLILFNDITTTPTSFGIIKVNSSTTAVISSWRYNISGSANNQAAASLVVGDNGNYFVGANEYAGLTDYNKGLFLEIDRVTGSLIKRADFTLPRLAIYDIAQLNADEWILGGTYYKNHYRCLIMKFNVATNIVTHNAFDLSSSHNNIDKLAIDRATQRVYFVSSLWNGQQEDVGFTGLTGNLVVGWSYKTNTTAIGANERASSLMYDAVNNRLLVSGKNSIGNNYGFLFSINAQNGNLLWGKHLANVATSNKLYSFSCQLINNKIFFTSILNNDIIWGREFYTAEVSDCFDELNYSLATLPSSPAQEPLVTSNPIVDKVDVIVSKGATTYGETVNCIKDEGLPTGAIKYDNSICIGSCITITDESLKADEWFWVFNGGTPLTHAGPTPPDICYNTAGTYTIRLVVSNIHGKDTLDSMITVNPLPEVFTYQDLSWCGKDTFKLAVAGTASTHEWFGFQDDDILLSDNKFIPANTNVYKVVGTDDNGCQDSASFLLTVLHEPQGRGFEKLICLEDVIVLDAGNPDFDYLWSDNSTKQTITVDTTGIYSVKVSNPCYKKTFVFDITEKDCNSQHYIPSAFRPNGDGVNDEFTIPGNNIIILKLEVFNRWGVKVFEGNEGNNFTWDGKYQGVYVEEETYIYMGVIRIVTGRKIRVKGNLTVLR